MLNNYLKALQPTLANYQGDSLTDLMVIITFDPPDHQAPQNHYSENKRSCAAFIHVPFQKVQNIHST